MPNNPFFNSTTQSSSEPTDTATTETPSTSPTTHDNQSPKPSYLPGVRKYLFSPTSNNEPRRRLSGSGSLGASHLASSSGRTNSAGSKALPELNNMVDGVFGPVGEPNACLERHLGGDRLADTLNSTKQERERLLLQFLRARHHNANEALLMIKSALQWRNRIKIEQFLINSRTNLVKDTACFPMHIISHPNSCKQPVVYGLIRLLDKKKADRESFQNALLSFLESAYFGDTYILDEMVVFLDFRDWSIRRNAPYRLVKDGIQTLQDFYPERLGRVFLVNYPTSIRAAYTAVSPIIDAGAKEKIVWIGEADPSTTLRKYVSPSSIPSFMGGELDANFPPTWPDIAAEFASHGGGRFRA